MYDIPGRDDIAKVVVTRESVIGDEQPTLVTISEGRRAS
jgi:ATP-dependent protease Clp ATPase subunit